MRALAIVEARKQLSVVLAAALERARSRAAIGIAASALLHLAVLFVLTGLNVRAGDPTATPVLFVEDFSPRAPRQTSQPTPDDTPPLAAEAESAPPSPDAPKLQVEPEMDAALAEQLLRMQAAALTTPSLASEVDEPAITFDEEPSVTPAPPQPPELDVPRTRKVEIAPSVQATVIDRVMQAAQTLVKADSAEVAWQEEGREYRAVLKRAANADSMELEQVAAEVTMTDQGASMQTKLLFSRLAFSQFSQVVDRWDPNVQLHDDEIVGRFHSNSMVFVGATAEATPKFTGKVTTAARTLRFASGSRRRQSEMFQGGLETSAGRIDFPRQAPPFQLAPMEPDAHVRRFEDDVHITLAGDGSYTWQARRSEVVEHVRYESGQPVYLIASPKATLYVRGVSRGRVLLYSPERIVIEGSVTYANDPRTDDSDDYLGLVSDGNVEIARPYVTGRGDLRIDAAIFARRYFLITDLDHRRHATLWIYGSLTAGTMSASEPRYATKIEFDPRFDRVRPPGFPSTNRFELASWDRSWLVNDEAPLAVSD